MDDEASQLGPLQPTRDQQVNKTRPSENLSETKKNRTSACLEMLEATATIGEVDGRRISVLQNCLSRHLEQRASCAVPVPRRRSIKGVRGQASRKGSGGLQANINREPKRPSQPCLEVVSKDKSGNHSAEARKSKNKSREKHG